MECQENDLEPMFESQLKERIINGTEAEPHSMPWLVI